MKFARVISNFLADGPAGSIISDEDSYIDALVAAGHLEPIDEVAPATSAEPVAPATPKTKTEKAAADAGGDQPA